MDKQEKVQSQPFALNLMFESCYYWIKSKHALNLRRRQRKRTKEIPVSHFLRDSKNNMMCHRILKALIFSRQKTFLYLLLVIQYITTVRTTFKGQIRHANQYNIGICWSEWVRETKGQPPFLELGLCSFTTPNLPRLFVAAAVH